MRLNNRSREPIFNFINTLLLILVFLGIALFFLEKYKFPILGWSSFLFIIVPVLLYFIFYLLGRQLFEYDSDGEALNFKNRSVSGLHKPLNDEFPKYKLKKYDMVKILIYKKLYITISSKKSHSIILKYDISYLTNNEIRDLHISLNNVVKNNRENKSDL